MQKCTRELIEAGDLAFDLVRQRAFSALRRTLEEDGLSGDLALWARPRMRYLDYMGREVPGPTRSTWTMWSNWTMAEYSLYLDLNDEEVGTWLVGGAGHSRSTAGSSWPDCCSQA